MKLVILGSAHACLASDSVRRRSCRTLERNRMGSRWEHEENVGCPHEHAMTVADVFRTRNSLRQR